MNYKSKQKKAFIENKELHGLKTVEIAIKLGVSESTVRKWKRAVGIDTTRKDVIRMNHAKRAMAEDRYLISAGGIAKYALHEISDMYKISSATASRLLKELGITPKGKVYRSRTWSETQPKISKKAKFVCQQMQAWSRAGREAQ